MIQKWGCFRSLLQQVKSDHHNTYVQVSLKILNFTIWFRHLMTKLQGNNSYKLSETMEIPFVIKINAYPSGVGGVGTAN